jgi:general secretion pathway protein A
VYEGFYKLAAKPFQLTPDPRFFFSSAGHKRALSYLRYGMKQGEGFIIVTGDVGTGKSMLVSTLFQFLARENVVAAQIVTTQMQADDLVRMVAAAFGLKYERTPKAALLHNLEVFFRACRQEGKRVLLVVDEAQNLPRRSIEELRMLSNFTHGGRALLQSFLLGQREFRSIMRSEGFEQLRQRVIAAYHLRPLGPEETRGYIEHRLRTASWQGDPSFAEEVFEAVYRFTEGVPRRINTLCDRLLLFGYLEELHHIGSEAIKAVTDEISEEQGGPDDAPLPPAVPAPRLVSPASRSAGQADKPRNGGQAPAKPAAAPEEEADPDRMAAVEKSVVDLASTLREELSLLRRALLDKEQKNGGKGGNGQDQG